MDRRRIRETCICDTPTRAAISDWVRSSMNRSPSTSRSRSDSSRAAARTVSRSSALTSLTSARPNVSTRLPLSPSVVGTGGLQRVEHVLERQLHVLRERLHRRCSPLPGGQPLIDVSDLDRELLRATGYVHGPAEVTEVALELTEDRRYRKRRERGPAVGVVAVHRLDQAEAGHLQQIIERLMGAAVAARQLARQR